MVVGNCACGTEKRMGSVFTVAHVDPPDLLYCDDCGMFTIDALVYLAGYPYKDADIPRSSCASWSRCPLMLSKMLKI